MILWTSNQGDLVIQIEQIWDRWSLVIINRLVIYNRKHPIIRVIFWYTRRIIYVIKEVCLGLVQWVRPSLHLRMLELLFIEIQVIHIVNNFIILYSRIIIL